MKNYESCSKVAASMGEKKDCAVRAVTMATYQDYEFVWKIFNDLGRKPGCGTPWTLIWKALDKLGRKVENVTNEYRATTVGQLGRELTKHDNILVSTSGHILCANEGQIHDWTKGRRHRIKAIYRVLSK